ncbi:uncharacterized protein L969DRAFT_25880 [Mixia osmundae IAM 14324]|uniref:Golgi apparatus membrane protein TVP38 n=1 Tax=Mixia osmundae (strain CBS 9802 / IAM 14324 / JCM 22182 / KY 12970) TaxID=764103 RepID=G7DUS4_MIXOS|nr:uncharacterized protein L969DRAFT_25880 [Mixia osmundae IAM 14324]KEI37448.1 hypothetical protein L969DRAFT_25880 [Mixia osmundae IAM 14324]GAA94334.1 hypothetical protein E5Q_00985 [Mixia osmundae IAM 14324]
MAISLRDRLHALEEQSNEALVSLRDRYDALSPAKKLGLLVYFAVNIAILIAFVVIGPSQIFRWLVAGADRLRQYQFGALFLILAMILTAIPPLFGYSTMLTLAGFTYGMWRGWLVACAGCLLGSAVSFLICRRVLKNQGQSLRDGPTFRGLEHAMRKKGLFLICLVRFCPFPFAYSNAALASIEAVSLVQFMIATLTITPKLLVHSFVGSRIYLLADPDHELDATSKRINAAYIALGTLVGFATSYYIYRLTLSYSQSMSLQDETAQSEDGWAGEFDEFDDDEDLESAQARDADDEEDLVK